MSDLKLVSENAFHEVLEMIKESRAKAFRLVNKELIDLYWKIGEYISFKCESAGWGSGVVKNLAEYLQKSEPGSKGFSSQNLWRMKQFYEIYHENEKLSQLAREVSWTNNMLIVAHAKTDEEREFYLKLTARENYSKKELSRQMESGLFERTMMSRENISPVARDLYPTIHEYVRDHYSFEFLQMEDKYSERGFQKAILRNLKEFILEFGKDFLFMAEEFKLQVGNKDYSIDLLFYHRELISCRGIKSWGF